MTVITAPVTEPARRWRWRARSVGLVAVAVALAAITLAVRLPGAFSDPLWGDEVASARIIATEAPGGALLGVARSEATPPAFYALGWATARAGDAAAGAGGPAALRSAKVSRLWSVLFALATVGLVVLLAARFMPLPGAALAGLMVALGYQFVEHGKELRTYSLFTLTVVAFPFLLERAVENPRRARLAALAGLVVLGSMTHYFFMLSVATGIVWLLLLRPGRDVVRRVLVAIAVGSIPLVVWMPVFIHQTFAQRDAHGWIGQFSIAQVAFTPANLFVTPGAWGDLRDVARLAFLTVVLAGCAVLWRTKSGRLVALLVVVPPIVVGLIWLAGERVYDTRNLLVIGPFVAVAVAAAIAAIPHVSLAVAAGIAAACVMVVAVDHELRLGRTPHDRIADTAVELGWTQGSPVVLFGPYWGVIPLSWSLPGHPVLRRRAQKGPPCARAFVIVETTAGRRWLRTISRQILDERTLPYYGAVPRSKRRPEDLRVVVIHWTPELARDATARGGRIFQSNLAPRGACGLN